MYLKHFYDPDLAQGSYMIGCQATGEAVVVDARRDTAVYLEEASRQGLRVVAVTETHIHADYLSGSRELAAATGARLLLSAEGGPDWLYRFPHEPLRDGDTVAIGNITLKAVHTPGHTPEHLSFLVTDGATAAEPGFFLTGDFVFVGDVGRPDLLDEAAGGVDTRFEGARRLFASLRDRFMTLPDYVQVWPGHGAGSACGKALGAVASTTVGYERNFAWWSRFVRAGDEQGFARELLAGQPDAPLYFGRMKRQNRAGPALLGALPPLREVEPDGFAGHLLVDTRNADTWNADGLVGALHVPAGKRFATYASYVLDPEAGHPPLVLLARDAAHAGELRDTLLRIGVDEVAGYVADITALPRVAAPMVAPASLAELDAAFLLDVRTAAESDRGMVPGATRLHAGRVMWHLHAIPADRPVVVHCESGARAAVVASALRLQGVDARELTGSYPAWREWSAVSPAGLEAAATA